MRDRAPEPPAPTRAARAPAASLSPARVARKERHSFFAGSCCSSCCRSPPSPAGSPGGRPADAMSLPTTPMSAPTRRWSPPMSGPIVAVHVNEGQHVAVGDPLFDLDPAPYETALALAQRSPRFGEGRVRELARILPQHTIRSRWARSRSNFARPTSTARRRCSKATAAPARMRTRPPPRWCKPNRSSNSSARSSRPRK